MPRPRSSARRQSRPWLHGCEDRIVPANDTLAGVVAFPNPTINNLSIVWPITGDDDLDATVAVSFRKLGDTAWRGGMNLMRVPAGTNTDVGRSWVNKFAGSIFDVQAATTYEVQLALTDPDGGSTTFNGNVTTRAVPTPMAGAKVTTVTPATLGSTLAKAVAGDIIELGAGNYAPFTVGVDGKPGQPIVIRDSNGDAVLTGHGGAGNAIDLTNRSYVIVDGLTINNGRVKLNNTNTVAIVRCTLNASGDGLIALTRSENLYIADNKLTGQGQWIESDLGANGFDGGEGIIVIGPGHVIEHNYVKGFRDLISLQEGVTGSDQWSIDIVDNDLYVATDDAVEADYAEGNVRVMRNRITDCFMGISSQPSLGGPSYFIRNAMYNIILHAFKLHRNTVGDVGLHNTVVKNGDAFSVYSGVPHERGWFRNNLFIGGPGGVYNGFDNGPGRVADLSYAAANNSFDYDGYGSSNGTFNGKIGAVTFSSLGQLRANTTEIHAVQLDLGAFNAGVAYPSSPLAAELAPADFRLRAGSIPEDAGQVLPNVNDGFGGPAPDLGAIEFGATLPVYGKRVTIQATYYIATNGVDVAGGGSSAAPWKTLQYAADRVKAGDSVIVRPGDYTGFYLETDGTASAPITFTGEKGARITNRNATTADGINLEGADYIVIQGFTVDNAGGLITRAGIRSVTNNHVTIRNNSADLCGYWGILTGFSDDVLIENNVMSRSKAEHGIYVGNSGDRPVIRNNTVWGNAGNGIHMNGDKSQGGDGIISNALVENNVIYDNGAIKGGSGINCDGVQNSRFQNNLLYNNHASGISLYKIDGGAASINNVVVNNTVFMAADGRWCLNIQNASTGNQAYNNVLLSLHAFRGSIDIGSTSLPGFVSNNNLVMDRFTTDGSTIITLAQWRTATNQDKQSAVSTPTATFVNPAANDYHLKTGSPSIDTGTATQAPARDLAAILRPQGKGFDIGAYEYVIAAPARVTSVQVNDGNVQRSRVTSLAVTFDAAVSLPATPTNAFQLKRLSDSATVTLSAVQIGNVVTLTFTGGAVDANSLADGKFTLTVLAAQVNGGQFDGNGDGTAGDNYDFTLHRLFGDADGDSDVDTTDFAAFRGVYGGTSSIFDFDNDGDVDTSDFGAFRGRFGANV